MGKAQEDPNKVQVDRASNVQVDRASNVQGWNLHNKEEGFNPHKISEVLHPWREVFLSPLDQGHHLANLQDLGLILQALGRMQDLLVLWMLISNRQSVNRQLAKPRLHLHLQLALQHPFLNLQLL